MDGRPYLLRGARENALTKKIGNNFSCTCLRGFFNFQIQSRCCTTVMLLVLHNVTMASLRTFARKVAADDETWRNNNQT